MASLTPGGCGGNSLVGMGAVIGAATVDIDVRGTLPEVFSTSFLSFLPGTVTTGKTPPPPTGLLGTRVVDADNTLVPGPIGTATPASNVYPVCVLSAVLWEVLVA